MRKLLKSLESKRFITVIYYLILATVFYAIFQNADVIEFISVVGYVVGGYVILDTAGKFAK